MGAHPLDGYPARSRGAATYVLSTPRTTPGTHPTRMSDAALHLGLFEPPAWCGDQRSAISIQLAA